jgi:hypothetical protein
MKGTAGLRPEIVAEAGTALREGRWDDAIFGAFRYVEAQIQKQAGSSLIGSPLVSFAFAGTTARLRISPDASDAERLVQLFSGSLGFLKGDRSHGQAPAVPCPDEPYCERALALASYLLDLLDLDQNAAPAINSLHFESGRTLELETLRATNNTEVLIDGVPADVVSRDGDLVRVELPDPSRQVAIRLCEGRRMSAPVAFTPQPPAKDDNFQYVDEANVPIYDAPTAGTLRPRRAVRLHSYQGGRPFIQTFPAARPFAAGEYVSWDWSLSETVPESWAERGGSRYYAWTGSALFAGNRIGTRGIPQLSEIQVRPGRIQLRQDDRCPVRVIAFYRDGPACWREDVTERASVRSMDSSVVLVTAELGLVAKGAGQTEIRVSFEGLHARASADVAALASGTVTEWLGGYRRMVGLLFVGDDLFIAHQHDRLLVVRSSMKIDEIARVLVPENVPNGLDTFTAGPNRDLYVRTLWNREVLRLDHASGYTRSARVVTVAEHTAVMSLAWSTRLDGLLVGDSQKTIFLWRDGTFRPWIDLPFNAVGLYPTDEALLMAVGGGQFTGYARADWDQKTLVQVTPMTLPPLVGTALLPRKQDVLVADFTAGRVVSIRNSDDRAEVVADGLTNPTALAQDREGAIYVANFGGDSISKILA